LYNEKHKNKGELLTVGQKKTEICKAEVNSVGRKHEGAETCCGWRESGQGIRKVPTPEGGCPKNGGTVLVNWEKTRGAWTFVGGGSGVQKGFIPGKGVGKTRGDIIEVETPKKNGNRNNIAGAVPCGVMGQTGKKNKSENSVSRPRHQKR